MIAANMEITVKLHDTIYMLALLFSDPQPDPLNNSIVFFFQNERACVAMEIDRNKGDTSPTRSWRCLSFYCGLGATVKITQGAWKPYGVPRSAYCADDRRVSRPPR